MTKATQTSNTSKNSSVQALNAAITSALGAEKQIGNAMGKLGLALVDLARSNKQVSDLVSEYGKGAGKERMQEIMTSLCLDYVDGYRSLVETEHEGKRSKQEASKRVLSIRKCMERGVKIAALVLIGKTADGKGYSDARLMNSGLIRLIDDKGEEVDDSSSSALVAKGARDVRGDSGKTKGAQNRKAGTSASGMSLVAASKFLASEVSGLSAHKKTLSKEVQKDLRALYVELVAFFKEEETSKVYKDAANG